MGLAACAAHTSPPNTGGIPFSRPLENCRAHTSFFLFFFFCKTHTAQTQEQGRARSDLHPHAICKGLLAERPAIGLSMQNCIPLVNKAGGVRDEGPSGRSLGVGKGRDRQSGAEGRNDGRKAPDVDEEMRG